ncbi:MAG TPA: isocitrate lyase/phosphoenolpyruvate mutase family protein [Gammaproteobacteria bacterium]|nr:isocitrate lyase/phosphoenolpyruvate mutase family protein [Gammaproteobacteria bacterium]
MQNDSTQKRRAELLRSLHRTPPILVLPNAWDAASAALFARAGARAVATTSAGVANALGFADGQAAPLAQVLAATQRMAAAVQIPVSADLEAGYAETPAALQAVMRQLLATGAVGVNLEDGLPPGSSQPLRDIADQQARLRAARAAADEAGIPLVINARTDVFLHQVGAPDSRLGETLRRLQAYAQAGADCLFAPGVADATTIAALVRSLKLPLNVLAGPATPAVAELEKLGVARVSIGSGLHRASLAFAERLARDILAGGGFQALATDLTYTALNNLLKH